MTTMNPETKTRWTARLRSGEVPQGREYLRLGEMRCCLGVLCDLAGDDEIIEPRPAEGYFEDDYYDDSGLLTAGAWVPDPLGRWDYGQGNDDETLPLDVQEWAGLDGTDYPKNPIVRVPDEILPQLTDHARRLLGATGPEGTISLAQLNDSGVPFPVIADIIDATL